MRCNTERAVNFNLDAIYGHSASLYENFARDGIFKRFLLLPGDSSVGFNRGEEWVSRKWELRGVLDKEQEGAVSSL